jgi:hypothetical protein
MEINNFMAGFATAAVLALIIVGSYYLHFRCVMDDVLKEERQKLRDWARKEAQIRADEQVRDILGNMQVNMPVVLVNESNMDWGE